MMANSHGGLMERVAEIVGASALAIGAGLSAALLANSSASASALVGIVAASVGAALGWVVMRAVPADEQVMPLAEFALESVGPIEMEPAKGFPVAESAMILDDPLPQPAADSRVVALFGTDAAPTAGDMQRRIDRHLAREQDSSPPRLAPDATDALHEALDEIRRSLRQN